MKSVKKIFIPVLGIFSLGMSFCISALTAGLNDWFTPLVSVQISNQSGQTISVLKLHVQTAGVQHEILFQSLENQKTIEMQFFVQGEGGYRLEATLVNGQTLSGDSGYIESGYTVKEVVRLNGISSDVSR